MGWIIFFAGTMAIFLFTGSFKKWSRLWYAGVIAMAELYAIDSTLITLGAFSYQYPCPFIGKLPVFYWLSSFFGGATLAYYYPARKLFRLPYIVLSAFLFLLLELVMHFFGYFNYHNWTPLRSFFLDIIGFAAFIWTWERVNEIRSRET